jgi:hypothetical protein
VLISCGTTSGPAGLPRLALPRVAPHDLSALVIPAVGISVVDSLVAAGLVAKLGEDRIFPTLPTAVQAFKER